MRPGDRSAGNWSRNGCGTCAWNWGTSWNRRRCASPHSLLPSRNLASRLLHVRPHPFLPLDTAHLPPPPPSKQVVSPELIFLSSPMGRSGVQQGSRSFPMSGEERADGSLRVVYTATIRSCRPCPLREQCQWNGSETAKPRQVSVLLHPLSIGGEPLLWRDWSRRVHRRACMQLLRHQRVEVQREPDITPHRDDSSLPLSRASRVHSRLSWAERQARNARRPLSPPIKLHLFGLLNAFAAFLGLEGMSV